MLPGGNFRDYAAIASMNIYLRSNNIGDNPAAVFHYGSGSLVTRGFNTQDFHFVYFTPTLMTPLSPLILRGEILEKAVCYRGGAPSCIPACILIEN
jgi:hypothetical protein